MQTLFFAIAACWTGWLVVDGFLNGAVWVKGGAEDRFTRKLDMASFAHRVERDARPFLFWFLLVFYAVATGFFAWMALTR